MAKEGIEPIVIRMILRAMDGVKVETGVEKCEMADVAWRDEAVETEERRRRGQGQGQGSSLSRGTWES